MKKTVIWILLLILCLPTLGSAKEKKYRFGPIRERDGWLLMNFQVFDLINQDLIHGLQKGMTAALEFQIQLWDERPRLMKRLIAEEFVRMKVNYDTWDRRYVVHTPAGEPQRLQEDQMRRQCSELIDLPIAELDNMEPDGRYSLAIRVLLQPMSVENYEEIKRWLSGEVRQINPKSVKSAEPGKKAGDWLMGLILNLTGLGDRVITAKSPPFSWREGTVEMRGRE